MVDLPLVPVMPTTRRGPSSSANRSTSPRIGTPAALAAAISGWLERHAGAGHQQRQTGHVAWRAGTERRLRHGLGPVVERQHVGAGGGQRPRGGEAAPGHAQDAHLAAGVALEPGHRSFNVERPTSARTMAMIQNRMTIVGSCQPIFSK